MLLMSSKLNLDKFQDSTKKLHISKVHEKEFHLGLVSLPKFTSELPSCDNCGAHFLVDKIIYCVGSFGQWVG